jgi:putative IMPACT (imprinted ancient) family translation regulator
MQHSYTTIKSEVKDILLKEKGSKFIGFAFPVNNEKELKTALDQLRRTSKATHHCYALE